MLILTIGGLHKRGIAKPEKGAPIRVRGSEKNLVRTPANRLVLGNGRRQLWCCRKHHRQQCVCANSLHPKPGAIEEEC